MTHTTASSPTVPPKPAVGATFAGGAVATIAIWGWNSWRAAAIEPTFVIEGEVLIGAFVTVIGGIAGPLYRRLLRVIG